jgi:hypothetical protein
VYTYAEITGLLLADQEMPLPAVSYVVIGIVGLGVLYGIFSVVRKVLSRTMYDLEGTYGGGGGLRRLFRHKRLKKYDRDGELRGKARSFQDMKIEQLLHDGKRSEAAEYLIGLLNAAKKAGDEHMVEKYSKYSEELIRMYDEEEVEARGGKAVHLKK